MGFQHPWGAVDEDATYWILENTESNLPLVDTRNERARGLLFLTEAIDLLPEFAPLAEPEDPLEGRITQYQDRNIGVDVVQGDGRQRTTFLAIVSPDGAVSTSTFTREEEDQIPDSFDLVRQSWSGYFRIAGAEGIEIPAAAGGTDEHMNYATTVLPDAFDDTVVWVLMRGSSQLFKGGIYSVAANQGVNTLPDAPNCAPANEN